eukprot:Nk52_evm34s343 gene=Nk52_evmTU34s343
MAYRSRTGVFMQCREAVQARRGVVGWNRRRDSNSDTAALVPGGGRDEHHVALPPEWVDTVEEVQYTITRITARVKELGQLHENHISRPTFDDSMEEEQAIEILTQEITKLFQKCQRDIKGIGSTTAHVDSLQESKVARNVKSSLASQVQQLSSNFRKDQSTYLKRLRNREQKEKHYFKSDMLPETSSNLDEDLFDKGFTDQQLAVLEDNTASIHEREKEIAQIAKSIIELNEVFKEMSVLVIDQGTILDRIDYNIEQVTESVDRGYKQLKKAEEYQQRSKKTYCILILTVLVAIMLCLVITRL